MAGCVMRRQLAALREAVPALGFFGNVETLRGLIVGESGLFRFRRTGRSGNLHAHPAADEEAKLRTVVRGVHHLNSPPQTYAESRGKGLEKPAVHARQPVSMREDG